MPPEISLALTIFVGHGVITREIEKKKTLLNVHYQSIFLRQESNPTISLDHHI